MIDLVRYTAACLVLTALAFLLVAPAGAQPGWYLQAGTGIAAPATLKHQGWNLDTVCYPVSSTCPPHEGYRWRYKLPSDAGPAFSAALGRRWNLLSIEFGFAYRKRNLGQTFQSITHLDGSAMPPADNSDYSQAIYGDVGALSSRTILITAYYFLYPVSNKLDLYGGGGVGLSFMRVNDLRYADIFHCEIVICDPPASKFSGLYLADITDTVLSGEITARLDYHLSRRTVVSMEGSFGYMGKLNERNHYLFHAVPGLWAETTISRAKHLSLWAKVRYFLGT